MDEQNKQTQAYRGSLGPSKKDSSEELSKEEEKLSKMLMGHVDFFFWGGGGAWGELQDELRVGASSAAASSPPWPGCRQEILTSASSSIILDRPDTFGSLQFPEDPSAL